MNQLTFILIAFLLSTVAQAQMLDTITATTPEHSIALRQKAIETIWGGVGWHTPPAVPTLAAENLAALFGRPPESVSWLEWRWAIGSPSGMGARTLYVTFPGATCLMIIHAGHGSGFAGGAFLPTGVAAMVSDVAATNCDLILSSMPLEGDNLGLS